ncbi:acyl CoA binding protein-domain-containing protein [Trichophaea hybrida]|nr:acyl CoA binding protein-domain-containing protein [Trichophaea hybrida]
MVDVKKGSPEFQAAAEKVNRLKTMPLDTQLLQIYALFKQVTAGDLKPEDPVPGTFDFKGKAKYRARKEKEGMSAEDAEKEYIELVDELVEAHGLSDKAEETKE